MHPEGSFAASLICAAPKACAAGILARQLEIQPTAPEEYGRGVADLEADTEVRLGYLAEAMAADRPALFHDQLAWLKVLCASRGVPLELVRVNLQCMAEELAARLPGPASSRAARFLESGLAHFDAAPSELPSFLAADAPFVDLARQFLLAVLETREADAIDLVVDAAEAGIGIGSIQRHVFETVQTEVGRMWQMAEITIAEEHYCTEIVRKATLLLAAGAPRAAPNGKRVIAASVSNDLHDLGIRMVSQGFEIAGWKVMFLGANVPATALIEASRDFGADLISISVSIMLHVRKTAEAIEVIKSHPITAGVPILVGGRLFREVDDLWQVVGADGCATLLEDAPRIGTALVAAAAV